MRKLALAISAVSVAAATIFVGAPAQAGEAHPRCEQALKKLDSLEGKGAPKAKTKKLRTFIFRNCAPATGVSGDPSATWNPDGSINHSPEYISNRTLTLGAPAVQSPAKKKKKCQIGLATKSPRSAPDFSPVVKRGSAR